MAYKLISFKGHANKGFQAKKHLRSKGAEVTRKKRIKGIWSDEDNGDGGDGHALVVEVLVEGAPNTASAFGTGTSGGSFSRKYTAFFNLPDADGFTSGEIAQAFKNALGLNPEAENASGLTLNENGMIVNTNGELVSVSQDMLNGKNIAGAKFSASNQLDVQILLSACAVYH